MTTLVWDGKTFAADRQRTRGNTKSTCTKIFKIGKDMIIGGCGDSALVEQLKVWVQQGMKPELFPDQQRQCDDGTGLMIVERPGVVYTVNNTPYPVKHDDKVYAMGSGTDFALAALACGKNAAQAVGIASQLDAYTGGGVDTLRFTR